MTVAEFERRLTQRLCWACGGTTHASHLGQRQCSKCRKKWSYVRLERRWKLARLYACQIDCDQAAVDAGVSRKTAGQVYASFRTVLRFSDGDRWRHVHPFRGRPAPAGLAGKELVLEVLLETLLLPRIRAIGRAETRRLPAEGYREVMSRETGGIVPNRLASMNLDRRNKPIRV